MAPQQAAEAAALREENRALMARVEELDRDNGVLKRGVAEQHMQHKALERDIRVLKHGVVTLHQREEASHRATVKSKAGEEEARREAAELRKVAEQAANYALAAQMLATNSCHFQAFHGPDVF